MSNRILLVEGSRCGSRSWAPALVGKSYKVTTVYTRREAQRELERGRVDLLILDSRFLRFDPYRLCRSLRDKGNDIPTLLIIKEDDKIDRGGGVNAHLREPFTARKLINRVVRLLPAPSTKVLQVGDLHLDVQLQTVGTGRANHRLTPKQARLLQTFMRHPGQVLTRRFLMNEVWDTDFVGDTRTLEVHIHWLRQAIEEDPSDPVRLVTVRRVGYRLDVPPARSPRRRKPKE